MGLFYFGSLSTDNLGYSAPLSRVYVIRIVILVSFAVGVKVLSPERNKSLSELLFLSGKSTAVGGSCVDNVFQCKSRYVLLAGSDRVRLINGSVDVVVVKIINRFVTHIILLS